MIEKLFIAVIRHVLCASAWSLSLLPFQELDPNEVDIGDPDSRM